MYDLYFLKRVQCERWIRSLAQILHLTSSRQWILLLYILVLSHPFENACGGPESINPFLNYTIYIFKDIDLNLTQCNLNFKNEYTLKESPRLEVKRPFLFVGLYSLMCIGSAFSPLMYHASCAAGIELWETHVTLTLSPILYLGWPPIISGPWSGKSITL